ncbi:MarR family transcriptional regulator [Clostridium sp.]|uniref:MarR family winged helix-turn-helix transcriptional regulator n=1 Tax=Clostridium sp. TaxID=1506 RepID=UPI00261C56AF|nr:MarR family transcriptional regulator [Clostridium sp.]
MSNLENLNLASDELYSLLLSLNRKVFNHDDIIKRLSIPSSHAKVIFYLIYSKNASVSKIAKDLSISKSNMTPIIDKLIKEGFVERFPDPNDRRVIRIGITQKGYEFSTKQREFAKKNLREKISSLSSEDLVQIEELTKKLNEILLKIN